AIPIEFSLEQNYPNPFNPTTNIVFNLPKLADVKLTVYTVLGQRIAVLIDNEKRAAGKHTVQWDGRDKAGNLVSSGVYLVRLEAGQFTAMRKIVLMK
ncbi:T9SS type A sorting domain-containing protein, partial [bacterium]|nr:T9SS type A sorting domain-containing protein [bacterium]